MRVSKRLINLSPGWFLKKWTGIKTVSATWEETWIQSPQGHDLYVHVHYPEAPGIYPAVVMVPGGMSAGTDFDHNTEVTARDIASLGFVAVHYDPSGRGRSQGMEDFWGQRHQRELAEIIAYTAGLSRVTPLEVCVMSFSIGIVIAVGALAKYSEVQPLFLYDWEGPSNRFNITKNDSHPPLMKFPTSNDDFWKTREPVQLIPQLQCAYFRYQAARDHLQGKYKGHAVELINAAVSGKADWTRLNDNPPNVTIDLSRVNEYHWLDLLADHKGSMLGYLVEVWKTLRQKE